MDIRRTYIEFQGESDKLLSQQIEKRQLSWDPVQIHPRSSNAYRTEDPPYVVLNQLESRGYKVVGTHTVKEACMWTLSNTQM